jgi:hypothetical protein
MTLDTKSIRERAERATPGPWRCRSRPYGHDFVSVGRHPPSNTPVVYIRWPDAELSEQDEHNGAFIAAARTDVPALCDEVDSLRAALAKAERERDEARAFADSIQKLRENDARRYAIKLDDARRETFESTREACIHEARAAKAVWSDSCAHERMAAQEACDYIASAIQAYVKPADVGTPAPATDTGDELK